MIVIIEGPDGSGKSTLAKNIMAGNCKYKLIKRNKPVGSERKNVYKDYAEIIESVKPGDNVILDRAFYSHMVYSEVMDDQDPEGFGVAEMDELESLLRVKGGLIIYCTGDPEEIHERAKERGETHVKTLEQTKRISAGYDSLFYDLPHKLPIIEHTIEPTEERACET